MFGLEITLLIAGAVIIVVSFLFFSKNEETNNKANLELTNKQKEDMRNQILSIFDEQMENIQEKTEITLDKMSNQKMMEMNEYSETILGEINRNHNEVMFLYDMLNEKKKEVTNTVKELNLRKKELQSTPSVAQTDSEEADMGFMAGEKAIQEEKKTSAPKTRKATVLDQLDAVSHTVSDDVQADEDAKEAPKTRKKATPAKTAATRTRTAVKKETDRDSNKDVRVFETGNNNEKILSLNAQGKSNVEIAKELGLGIGEVKLVIDLFRGGRS